ncbi:MAG: hypothetical protein K2L83_06035 [Muribaculaceae bacterium]|nr:hypothetical protein [Muribaculaceae bacterium]
MSKAKLKKALKKLPKEQLIEMVVELYSSRKEAKEYLDYWLEPDEEKELERCKTLVGREFFTPGGVARRTPTATSVNRIIKSFESLCCAPEHVAELRLTAAETLASWIEKRKRRSTYMEWLKREAHDIELYATFHELEERFELRCRRLQELAEDIEQRQERMRRHIWWHS